MKTPPEPKIVHLTTCNSVLYGLDEYGDLHIMRPPDAEKKCGSFTWCKINAKRISMDQALAEEEAK